MYLQPRMHMDYISVNPFESFYFSSLIKMLNVFYDVTII